MHGEDCTNHNTWSQNEECNNQVWNGFFLLFFSAKAIYLFYYRFLVRWGIRSSFVLRLTWYILDLCTRPWLTETLLHTGEIWPCLIGRRVVVRTCVFLFDAVRYRLYDSHELASWTSRTSFTRHICIWMYCWFQVLHTYWLKFVFMHNIQVLGTKKSVFWGQPSAQRTISPYTSNIPRH